MIKPTLVLSLFISLLGVAATRKPVDFIDPFVGTGHFGKTFPGAATPGGMVQLSPDTITGGDHGSGYRNYHKTIQGFSMTHMSGVGWYGDLGNFLVMPTTGPLKTWYGATDKPGTVTCPLFLKKRSRPGRLLRRHVGELSSAGRGDGGSA